MSSAARNGVEKCLNCQYYDRRQARASDGEATMWGQCRRQSPNLNPMAAKNHAIEGVWPLVRDDDWCGQWTAPTRFEDTVAAARLGSVAADANLVLGD